MPRTFEQLWVEQAVFSRRAFGADADRGPVGPLKHLALEVAEVLADPSDLREYSDCLLLLIDAARRAGFEPHHLLNGAFNKLEINNVRKWAPPTSDEPVLHVE